MILSLENHCSMEQQEVLAQQLKTILGEQLLTTTTDGRVPTQLPSPEVGTVHLHWALLSCLAVGLRRWLCCPDGRTPLSQHLPALLEHSGTLGMLYPHVHSGSQSFP